MSDPSAGRCRRAGLVRPQGHRSLRLRAPSRMCAKSACWKAPCGLSTGGGNGTVEVTLEAPSIPSETDVQVDGPEPAAGTGTCHLPVHAARAGVCARAEGLLVETDPTSNVAFDGTLDGR